MIRRTVGAIKYATLMAIVALAAHAAYTVTPADPGSPAASEVSTSAAAGRNWGVVTEFRGAKTEACRVRGDDVGFRKIYYRHNARHADRKSRSAVSDKVDGTWYGPYRTAWARSGKVGGAYVIAFGTNYDWPLLRSEIQFKNGDHKSRKIDSTELPFC